MDRFRELETFVAVAQHGGFNAAAGSLNLSPPSVTRLVSALEERLGMGLFVRTTRQVSLTDAGQLLLPDAIRVLEELNDVEAKVTGAKTEPQGLLSVTAPVTFGQKFIAPIVCDFVDASPKVTARTFFVDRVVNMIEEGLDVAVRIGNLPDSTLKATRVGSLRWVLVAAPSYLANVSPLKDPGDLIHHRIIQVSESEGTYAWHFSAAGKQTSVTPAPALRCNTITTSINAAVSGWGITRALSYQVADELKSGKLIELLGDFEDRRIPIHLLHAEGRLAAAKIRSFVGFASQALKRAAKTLEAA